MAVRVPLRLLGEEVVSEVVVPTGPRSLTELLPVAHAVTDQATGFILGKFAAAGHPASCRAGCAACCRQLVAVSLPEALALADHVASLPAQPQAEVRARFASALRRLERANLLARDPPGGRALQVEAHPDHQVMVRRLSRRYFSLGIACPFLEDESCGVYQRRPAVCREYHVLSPAEECARPEAGGVVRVEVRLGMTSALARTAGELLGEPPRTVPLVLALEWAEAGGQRLREKRDGAALFRRE